MLAAAAFDACHLGQTLPNTTTTASRQLVGGDVPAAGAGAGQGGRV